MRKNYVIRMCIEVRSRGPFPENFTEALKEKIKDTVDPGALLQPLMDEGRQISSQAVIVEEGIGRGAATPPPRQLDLWDNI